MKRFFNFLKGNGSENLKPISIWIFLASQKSRKNFQDFCGRFILTQSKFWSIKRTLRNADLHGPEKYVESDANKNFQRKLFSLGGGGGGDNLLIRAMIGSESVSLEFSQFAYDVFTLRRNILCSYHRSRSVFCVRFVSAWSWFVYRCLLPSHTSEL